jgi:hypothetical protein
MGWPQSRPLNGPGNSSVFHLRTEQTKIADAVLVFSLKMSGADFIGGIINASHQSRIMSATFQPGVTASVYL